MWLREVVFQGVFGLERPAKVSVDPGFCGLVLPEGVGVQDFRTLIVSLLYPARVDGADLSCLDVHPSTEVRLGLVVSIDRENNYKVSRCLDSESAVLQSVWGSKREEIARGAQNVADELGRRLGLPSYETFLRYHCWEIVQDLWSAPVSNQGEKVRRLVDQLSLARKVERMDDGLSSMGRDLKELEREKSSMDKLISAVERRRARLTGLEEALGVVSKEEREILVDHKARTKAFEGRQQEYERDCMVAQDEYDVLKDGARWMSLPFLGACLVCLLFFVLSGVPGWRTVALANVLFMGGLTWLILRNLDRLETRKVQKIRVDQLSLHVQRCGRERGAEDATYERLMSALEISGPGAFLALESECVELRALPRQVDDETLKKSKQVQERYASLEERLASLQSQRDDLGEVRLAAYEVEAQFYELGLEPPREPEQLFEWRRAALKLIKAEARSMDLVEQGGLGPQVRGAWISALSRLSGRDWTDLDVKDDGEVVCGMGGRAWFESNSQMWAAACGLLAMIVRSSGTGDAGRGEFFCLATPYRGLDDDQRSCLKTIFKQYGEHHQFIILE